MTLYEESPLLPVRDSCNYTAENLSAELFQQHREDIARRRESNIPTTFVIPEERLVPPPDPARTVEILTGQKIQYNGEATFFKGPDVMMLNVLFAEEGALSIDGIMHHLNAYTTTQRRAVVRVMEKAHSATSGSFVKIEEDQNDLTYQIDPSVAFVDHRIRGVSRAEIIRSMVKQYSNDPRVQRAETILFRRGQKYAGRSGYDSVKFESLGAAGENELLDALNEIIERHGRGEATPDEQRVGTITFNKLVYSFLPFARYMVLESAGQIRGRRRTPLSGFLRRFSEDNLSRPVDDALQFAAVGVIKAIQDYDSAKGDLFPHVAMTVSFEVRSGILDFVRHAWGHTASDIKEHSGGRARRLIVQNEEDYELLSTMKGRDTEKDYEKVLSTITTRHLVHSAMRHPDFKPIDQLILSLSTGVYLDEFEGRSFKGDDGRVFLYDQHLLDNPIFREGIAEPAIANFLGTTTPTVHKVRTNALKLLEDALRQKTSQRYYKDKWQETFDWLD